MSTDVPPRRVAVIGSGLTGIYTAYLLSVAGVYVDLFERSDHIGMDSESVSVTLNGTEHRVDVPMRAFSTGYYPELTRLYKDLGIESEPTRFSFSFALASMREPLVPSIIYDGRARGGRLHFPLHSGAFSMVANAWRVVLIATGYLYLLILALYHSRRGNTRNDNHKLSRITFGEWASHLWLGTSFVCSLLLPMLSSILTTDMQSAAATPANELLEYVARSFLSQHYTVKTGVKSVVDKLIKPIPKEQVHLGVDIDDLFIRDNTVSLSVNGPDGRKDMHGYTHMVFATPACTSAKMISRMCGSLDHGPLYQRLERTQAELIRLRYMLSTVVVHTDRAILPSKPNFWRALNFTSPNTVPSPHGAPLSTMASHIVLRDKEHVVIQTTNPLPQFAPRRDTIISQSTFQRFILSLESNAVRKLFFRNGSLGELQGASVPGAPAVYVCGSWSSGIPLLEGCVSSARLTAASILQGATIH